MESTKIYKTPIYVRNAVKAYTERNKEKVAATKKAYNDRKKIEAKQMPTTQPTIKDLILNSK